METQYILPIITLIVTFLLAFANLFWVGKKTDSENKRDIMTYITCYALMFLSFLGTTIYTNVMILSDINFDDFIYSFKLIELLTIFAIAGVIFALYSLDKTKKFAFLSMVLGAVCLYYFIPNNYNLFNENVPLVLSKLSLVGIFLFLSFIFKYINGIEGTVAIQVFFIGIGLILISFIKATPLLIGLWGACLAGIFLAFYSFNSYPAKLKINTAGANSLGFIVAWLLIKNGEESSLGCSVIFALYFTCEATVAIAKRLTFLPKYQDIFTNTFSYQANIKGLSISGICTSVMKISILMSIIGCLQIYSSNPVSIPLFGAVVMLWFLNKLGNWNIPKQSLKEINRSLVDDLKENISEVKKIINKDN